MPVHPPPWIWPFVVLALAAPIVAGFAIGGPVLGLAAGAAAAAAVAVLAIRAVPREEIETATSPASERFLLVVLGHELEDPDSIAAVKRAGGLDNGSVKVRLLAPAQDRLLDRWASDIGPARDAAQRRLVISVAALGKADVEATAATGDADIVQAVEDELRSFPATKVVLVTGPRTADERGDDAAAELRRRLSQPFDRVVVES